MTGVQAGDGVWVLRELSASASVERRPVVDPEGLRVELVGEPRLGFIRTSGVWHAWPQVVHGYGVRITRVASMTATGELVSATSHSLGTQLCDGVHLLGHLAVLGCHLVVIRLLPRGERLPLLVEVNALLVAAALLRDAHWLAIAADSSSRAVDLRHILGVCVLLRSQFAREEVVVVHHAALRCLGALRVIGGVAIQDAGPGLLGRVAKALDNLQDFFIVLFVIGTHLGRVL